MEDEKSAESPRRRGGHDRAVLDAMTSRERWLTLTVLVCNLFLGAWLIQRSDFSDVKPNQRNAADLEFPTTVPAPLPTGPIVASSRP